MPVGFTTGKIDDCEENGYLVLSAVSNKVRGLGIYTCMIYEGVKRIQAEGLNGVMAERK